MNAIIRNNLDDSEITNQILVSCNTTKVQKHVLIVFTDGTGGMLTVEMTESHAAGLAYSLRKLSMQAEK